MTKRRTCQARTAKGMPCVNRRAKYDGQSHQYLCHLHHPDATFRQQRADQEAKRLAFRRQRIEARRLAESPYREDL